MVLLNFGIIIFALEILYFIFFKHSLMKKYSDFPRSMLLDVRNKKMFNTISVHAFLFYIYWNKSIKRLTKHYPRRNGKASFPFFTKNAVWEANFSNFSITCIKTGKWNLELHNEHSRCGYGLKKDGYANKTGIAMET